MDLGHIPPTPDTMLASQTRRLLSTSPLRSLTVDKLNPRVLEAQYAVRGELVLKSMQYAKELKNNAQHNLPFDSIIACNIGNPQAVGQASISFPRQVLSLCTCPELLNIPAEETLEDVVWSRSNIMHEC